MNAATLPSERLQAAGHELPAIAVPLGAYIPAKVIGDQVLSSGQLPADVDGQIVTGRLGAGLSTADGAQAAQLACLRALAAVAQAAGGLDRIREVVRVMVFVNSDAHYTEQALVANGASDLLLEVFGDAGRHVRSAVGVAVLPAGAAVEVELVVAI